MTARPDLVLDGGAAYLGLARRDGARLADLRKPLGLAIAIVRSGRTFRCCLDRNLPYRVREEDRGLLDLLLSEHPETFSAVPQGPSAEEHLLGRAAAAGASVVGAAPLARDPALLDRFPWLAEPGRFLPIGERDGTLSCPTLPDAPYAALTAFDLYDALLTTLPRP